MTAQETAPVAPTEASEGDAKMETDAQRHKRFHADFEKLKHNREKVPLQQLQTRWERPYNSSMTLWCGAEPRNGRPPPP